MTVHVLTRVETVFGDLDDTGSIVNKRKETVEIDALTEENFQALFQHLLSLKEGSSTDADV